MDIRRARGYGILQNLLDKACNRSIFFFFAVYNHGSGLDVLVGNFGCHFADNRAIGLAEPLQQQIQLVIADNQKFCLQPACCKNSFLYILELGRVGYGDKDGAPALPYGETAQLFHLLVGQDGFGDVAARIVIQVQHGIVEQCAAQFCQGLGRNDLLAKNDGQQRFVYFDNLLVFFYFVLRDKLLVRQDAQ